MRLRFLLASILLSFLFSSGSAQVQPGAVFIQKDSLPQMLNKDWRYHPGDDTTWADPAFNDSGWKVRSSTLFGVHRDSAADFPGIGWFRLYFRIDSSLVGKPLAAILNHVGASELFVDGARVARFGSIGNDSEQTETVQLHGYPAVFTLPEAGVHLLAVRYADPDAIRNYKRSNDPSGFSIRLGHADTAVGMLHDTAIALTFLSVFFFSFFFAFSLLHFILFLYYRAGRSNLWFAIFNLSLGVAFLSFFLLNVAEGVVWNTFMQRHSSAVITIAAAALSAFVNELFGRGRRRFRITIGLLLAGSLSYLGKDLKGIVILTVVGAASLEAIVLIVRAILRKVPGARIIGAGILLFLLMFLLLVLSIFALGMFLPHRHYSLDGGRGLLVCGVLVFTIISIPLSMSAYLAWYFARVRKNLARQLAEVGRLSAEARHQGAEKQRLLEHRHEELEQVVAIRTEELRNQKKKSDDLLLNILPAEIADELKEKGSSEARLYNDVSVLFTDFVDFTQMGERLSPAALVAEIDCCFKAFDEIVTRHGLEKIKTVGDAYIAVSGLPVINADHARDVVLAALEIRDFMMARRRHTQSFSIRLGVHSGPIVAGIVGIKKFAYDIWGDTVNTAARMEQHSEPDRLNISGATYELVKEHFRCVYRGELEVKHKGRMSMYFVEAGVSNVDQPGAAETLTDGATVTTPEGIH